MRNPRTPALTLFASASAVAVLLSFSFPREGAETAPGDVREVRGELAAWSFAVDGTMTLQVQHAANEGESGIASGTESTWFRTPPDSNELSDLEARVLDIVLTLEATPERESLLATGRLEQGRDGSSAENAVPLLSLSRP